MANYNKEIKKYEDTAAIDRNNSNSMLFLEDEYSGDERMLFDKYKLLNYQILIVGSYSLVSQRYTSDIDALSLITGKKDLTRFNTEFKGILRGLEIDDDIFFLEAKIQYNNGDKKKFFSYDKFDIPEKNFNNIYYIKFDTIVFLNGNFKAFDMIYYFRYTDDLIRDIENDIKEFNKTNLYLKVVKRYFSIAKVKNDIVKAKLITKFLNSKTGKDYELYNNLTTILILLENYGEDIKVRDKVRVILNILGINPKVSVIRQKISELSTSINNEAKLFLDKLLNKKNII
jgi:hypothetical protein